MDLPAATGRRPGSECVNNVSQIETFGVVPGRDVGAAIASPGANPKI
jgi:hypothetical protein